MKESLRLRLGLSLKYSLVSFLTFFSTGLLITLFAYFFVMPSQFRGPNNHNYGPEFSINDGTTYQQIEPYGMIIGVLLACVVVGTILSFFIGNASLKSIRQIVDSTNRLSKGNFSTRLAIKSPREFREVTDSFNRMAEELEGIEILRSDFINNFSHEFKTPIVSIKGFAEILAHDDLSAEEQREYLEIIIKESDRLSHLATKVLDLSKVETQMILRDVRVFNLAEQIRHTLIVLEPKWAAKNISISSNMQEFECLGDEPLLDQVWLNLIDNAIKFAPRHGTIDISLVRQDQEAVFTIQDSGVGVSEAAADHLFDKFYQADTSHATEGNGLGLTIAKRIMELHKGSIVLEANEGEGAQFVVKLPLV